jgi:iron complex outermembrane recepter protein
MGTRALAASSLQGSIMRESRLEPSPLELALNMPFARLFLAIVVTLSCTPAGAAPTTDSLADLSLEQLGDIEVTSVSKHSERLLDAPASIYVITAEDIRRSGSTTLPQALRLAPNLQVAQTSATTYAISARGFNNSLGNKLLVLIDGRTVYTPLFSGVFWDSQDVMLEDVERIEVISGPGATLWGANAVNGVINVITRSAEDTQGGLAAVGGGNTQAGGALRYGTKVGGGGYLRVYGESTFLQNTERSNGSPVLDGADVGQVGFRADWNTSKRAFMFQGNAYEGASDASLFGTPTRSGVNLVGRWTERLGNDSELGVQAYYDHTEREDPISFRDSMDILDIEAQHSFHAGQAHRMVWGGGYRYAHDSVNSGLLVAFIPPRRDLNWANLFAQDEIRLSATVQLTVGLKLESNDYTGVDALPTVRLAWKPTDHDLVWGAVSRAARAPSRIDREFFFPGNPPFAIRGGPDFQSEIADVIELGYRSQISSNLSFSITGFYDFYDRLRSGQPAPGGGFFVENLIEGTTTGIETWGTFQAARDWRLMAGFSWLEKDLKLKSGSLDPVGPSALGNDPDTQWMVRSLWNVTPEHEIDLSVRHVAGLPDPTVPAYTAVDLRLGWRPNKTAEFSLLLQNLFDPEHPEFDPAATRSEYGRSAYLRVTLRF